MTKLVSDLKAGIDVQFDKRSVPMSDPWEGISMLKKAKRWVLTVPVIVTVETPEPVDEDEAKELALQCYTQHEKLYSGEEDQMCAELWCEATEDDVDVVECD